MSRIQGRYLRNANFYDVSNYLLPHHDDGDLNAKLQEATLLTAASQSVLSQNTCVSSRRSNDQFGLKECDVNNGGEGVNKLEQGHFQSEAVFIRTTS